MKQGSNLNSNRKCYANFVGGSITSRVYDMSIEVHLYA